MQNDIIEIDQKWPACCAIDTEEFLTRTLGDEVTPDLSVDDTDLETLIGDKWLMQAQDEILAAIQNAEEGREYLCTGVDNVYNNENDFSSVFQWQVFYPADCRSGDWVWSDDCYVAIEVHQGGDVRGNYGRVRLYKVDSIGDSNFLDWMLGWNVEYSNGESVAENERFSIGYAQNPFYEMIEHIKGGESGLTWSDKHQCFVGWYEDGRAVKVSPYCYY